ncbi:hypothetical protein MBLNU459_g7657t2 [Dothideomycetes sp. NU459]
MPASTSATSPALILPEKPAGLPHPGYETPRGVSPLESVPKAGLQYPNYSPFKLPNLVEEAFVDRALSSDPAKRSLLEAASSIINFTPTIGTELVGLQLKALSDEQKNELGRLVAERGVVFLRDQDLDVHEQIEFCSYYGPLHIHQMAGIIPDLPWVHPIYKDETAVNGRSHQIWHSDSGPDGTEAGGDTIWASGYAVYEALSPKLRAFLETLEAKHSGFEQAQKALRTTGCLRRDPIETNHARNISIIGGNNIAFIKTYPGGSGYVTNITWENFRSKASLYGLNINQYWQNKNEPDTGSVALRNLMFRNFTGILRSAVEMWCREADRVQGSVADGTQRPPLYLVANDLTYAVNVTLEKILVWTENGTSAINKISNVFGHADSVYGVNDGLEALPSNGPPTSYTSTYTVTQAPTGYVEPTYPAWAVPTTGYGTASAIPVYTPAPLWEPNGDYDKHYWGSF